MATGKPIAPRWRELKPSWKPAPLHGRNRIKAARVKAGLSKRELAKLVAVTNQTIKKWEKGQQMPLREDVSAIAQACGTSPQWLLAGSKLRDDGHGS